VEARWAGKEAAQPLIDMQEELVRQSGKPKRTVEAPARDAALEAAVQEHALPKLRAALEKTVKQERYAALDDTHDETQATLGGDDPMRAKLVGELVGKLK